LVVVVGKALAARKVPARISLPALPLAAAAAAVAGAPVRRVFRPLIAVDGSESSLAAVRKAIDMRWLLNPDVETQVDLINVQRGVSGDVASFVSRDALQDYHRDRSEKALAPARALLEAAGLPFTTHQFVGQPGRVIAQFAAEQKNDQIIMGTRGLGSHTGALLGSVTQDTLVDSTVPVLVVK
jgi:nucleotide-binding universal stress UspA family protein